MIGDLVGPTLGRYLDPLETLCVGHQIVYVVDYCGHLDADALEVAFQTLRTRHPVLCGRIHEKERGHVLLIEPMECHGRAVQEVSYVDLDEDIDETWNPDVARLIFMEEDGKGRVILRVDHSMIDGRAGLALLHELLRYYKRIVDRNEVPSVVAGKLPFPPYGRLLEYFRSEVMNPNNSLVSRLSTRNVRSSRPLRRVRRMSPRTTADLVAIAQRRGSSVHALLCGAVMVAQRNAAKDYRGCATMACWTVVDMRSHVSPTIAPTDTSVFLANDLACVKVDREDDPISIGIAIKLHLDRSIARRSLIFDPLSVGLLGANDSTIDERVANAFISNKGNLPEFEVPAGLSIVDVRMFQTGKSVLPYYGFSTYGGHLSIEFYYPMHWYTQVEVSSLVDDVMRQLNRAASDGR